MYRNLMLWLCLLLAPLSTDVSEAKEPVAKKPVAKEPVSKDKELSGMSIVGNDDAPKALYIVPWKSSEIGMETNLNMMLTDSPMPVDRDVFMRQLDFFEVSTRK